MKFFSLLIILVLISGCKTRWSKRSGDKYDVQVGLVSKVGEEYDLNDSHRIKLYLLSKFKRRIRYDYEQGLLSKSQFEFYDRHAKDSPDDRMFKILISRIQADYKAGNLSKSYYEMYSYNYGINDENLLQEFGRSMKNEWKNLSENINWNHVFSTPMGNERIELRPHANPDRLTGTTHTYYNYSTGESAKVTIKPAKPNSTGTTHLIWSPEIGTIEMNLKNKSLRRQ